MSQYKVTIGLRQTEFKSTETYISPNLTLDTLGPAVTTLLERRAAMCFGDIEFVGVRISQLLGIRRADFYRPGVYTKAFHGILLTVPEKGALPDPENDIQSDQSRACLQVRLTYDSNRFVTRYLAMVPDAILTGEPASANLAAHAGFQAGYNSFVKYLIDNHWQIRARNRLGAGLPKNILTWARAAAGAEEVGIVLPKLPASGIGVGDRVQIGGVRTRGLSRLSYNGIYRVSRIITNQETDADLYTLWGSEIGKPEDVKTPGKVAKIDYTTYDIEVIRPMSAGIHKRGNSFGSPRGRRKTRVLLDP